MFTIYNSLEKDVIFINEHSEGIKKYHRNLNKYSQMERINIIIYHTHDTIRKQKILLSKVYKIYNKQTDKHFKLCLI